MAHDRLSRRNTQEQSSISVVVRVRPLLAHEIKRRSREIAEVAADERSVRLNIADRKNSSDLKDYSFSFVASPATSQEEFFSQCGVPRLLDYALDGYASTIFAYGQTGSGKTFSISGSEASAGESAVGAAQSGGSVDKSHGIIPRAIEYLFSAMHARQREAAEAHGDNIRYEVRTTFYEIYNELVFDLLAQAENEKGDSAAAAREAKRLRDEKAFGFANSTVVALELAQRNSLPVRFDEVNGGFSVPGLTTRPCQDRSQVLQAFAEGFVSRRRGSHKLNEDSSRSHAIMTLHIDIITTATVGPMANQSVRKAGKVVFVDLAGSERVKATGVTDSHQLKEATNINRSLFALGKVISALDRQARAEVARTSSLEASAGLHSDPSSLDAFRQGGVSSMDVSVLNASGQSQPMKEDWSSAPESHSMSTRHCSRVGSSSPDAHMKDIHVPYRDSKLTMLLMDSLGGSSRTLMIACISPAEEWSDESFSTLNYATRAKNIVNKPAVRLDKNSEIAQLHAEIRALQLENQNLKDRVASSGDDATRQDMSNPFRQAEVSSGASSPSVNRQSAAEGGDVMNNDNDAIARPGRVTDGPTPPPSGSKGFLEEDFAAVADLSAHIEQLRVSLNAVSTERDTLRAANDQLQRENSQLANKLETAEKSFLSMDMGTFSSPGTAVSKAAEGESSDMLAAQLENQQLQDKIEFMIHRERQLEEQVRRLQNQLAR